MKIFPKLPLYLGIMVVIISILIFSIKIGQQQRAVRIRDQTQKEKTQLF